MIYRKLGDTGFKVSRLGFGAMRPPYEDEAKTVIDSDLFLAIMHRAIDLGVNYFDTAHVYQSGGSEEHVGRAVVGRRDDIIIQTKVPVQKKVTDWHNMLKTSLKRLGTHIDILFMHGLRLEQTQQRSWEGILRRAQKAVDKGDVRVLGFSCHDTPENMHKLIDTGLFKVMLLQYNLLNRTNEAVIDYAHEKGLGVVLMGPVAGGMLAAPSRTLKRISPIKVKSCAELAMRFALSNKNVDVAFSGMNAFDQVDENVAVASERTPMKAADRRKLIKAVDERLSIAEKICTACGYCMPCPKEVNIPRAFRALTMKKVWGIDGLAQRMYDSIGHEKRGKKTKRPTACVKCGTCEEKCPQEIPIMKQLEEVVATFEKEAG